MLLSLVLHLYEKTFIYVFPSLPNRRLMLIHETDTLLFNTEIINEKDFTLNCPVFNYVNYYVSCFYKDIYSVQLFFATLPINNTASVQKPRVRGFFISFDPEDTKALRCITMLRGQANTSYTFSAQRLEIPHKAL